MKKSDASIQLCRNIASWIWRKTKGKTLRPSTDPIDVVIPIVKKDIDILPLCLQGIRENVTQQIKDIYIVAPNDEDIKKFCQQEKIVFVDETTVLNMSPQDLNLQIMRPNGQTTNRSGWLFQQLVKLSGRVGTCDYYLTIDADHILLRPHVFLTQEGTTVFYMSEECNTAYYQNIHRLTGRRYCSLFSYVDHKMLFSKQELTLLRDIIEEANSGMNWIDAILKSYDRTETSGFSEFELYGDFVPKKTRRPWRHLKLGYSQLEDYQTLRQKYADKYLCVTFPCYLKDK